MFKIIVVATILVVNTYGVMVEDMLGRKVEIKTPIEKIYASNPILLYSLYSVDKEKIAGLNFSFRKNEAKYLDVKTTSLPIVGGWFGQGRTPNTEMLLEVNPDLILLSSMIKKFGEKKIKSSLGSVDIPFFYLKTNNLYELIDSYSYLGKITGKTKRAKTLQSYAFDKLKISPTLMGLKNKPKVYYAEGYNGLSTECDQSLHAEIINLAGGDNVHKCEIKNNFGREQINFEQVLNYDPDIILVFQRDFYKKIFNEPQWNLLKAVKNKKVYFIPKGPFSWFDRPPSFMKIMGFIWLSSILHPEMVKTDIKQEAKDFYKLFLNINLSDEQLGEILGEKLVQN
jgi:iron complex transport system substrate-binding protein